MESRVTPVYWSYVDLATMVGMDWWLLGIFTTSVISPVSAIPRGQASPSIMALLRRSVMKTMWHPIKHSQSYWKSGELSLEAEILLLNSKFGNKDLILFMCQVLNLGCDCAVGKPGGSILICRWATVTAHQWVWSHHRCYVWLLLPWSVTCLMLILWCHHSQP